MLAKVVIVLNAVLYLVAIPYLEISDTHVYNPTWHGHARLHEVWQLSTHAALTLMALYLVWSARSVVMALLIILALNGGFLFSWLTQDSYGGSMKHSDGSELLVGGINPAFAIILVVTILASIALYREVVGGPKP